MRANGTSVQDIYIFVAIRIGSTGVIEATYRFLRFFWAEQVSKCNTIQCNEFDIVRIYCRNKKFPCAMDSVAHTKCRNAYLWRSQSANARSQHKCRKFVKVKTRKGCGQRSTLCRYFARYRSTLTVGDWYGLREHNRLAVECILCQDPDKLSSCQPYAGVNAPEASDNLPRPAHSAQQNNA